MFFKVEGLNTTITSIPKSIDSSKVDYQKEELIQHLQNLGFWTASVDSIKTISDTVTMFVSEGRKFSKVELELYEGDSLILKSDSKRNKSFQISAQFDSFFEEVLKKYENKGFPFVSIKVSDTRINSDSILIRCVLKPSLFLKNDQLQVVPDNIVSTKFLSSYLQFKSDDPFNAEVINNIPTQLKQLHFLALRSVDVSYQLKKASVILEIEKRKANYFDGVLGMVPRTERTGVEFTGEVNLKLRNLFKSGKKLDFHWEQIRPESQKLDLSYVHPVFLGSLIDLHFSLNQRKQDSIFSNRSFSVGFEYRVNPTALLKFNYENILGTSLENDSDSVGNFDIDYYGIGYRINNTDDLFFPRKGFQFELNSQVGFKKVDDSQFRVPKSTQYRFTANYSHFLGLTNRSIIAFSGIGGILINDYLYLNDLFRLGGLKSIRGFDEDDFYASHYGIASVEWRYYIDDQSYFLLFYDQAFLAYDLISKSFNDNPSGLGGGLQISTEGGDFRILYGMGRRSNERFSIDTFKIHFGYSALF